QLLNSRGLQASYEGTTVACDALAVAEGEGGAETGWSYQGARRYADLKPRQVGEEAAQKAVALLGAGTIPTRRLPVLLDPFVAAEFLQVLGPGLTADAVQKGKSLFRGRVGETVASPLVQLVDHGRLENGLASAPVDDEGVPTRETVLIADGVLRGYLYNTYTAARDGVASTGNGVRNSFRGTPEVRPSNFYLRPGAISRQRLWAESGEALYLTAVLGMHTANPISGDFSLGAAGLLLRDGQVVRPVRGVTVAGNLLALLQGIDGLADDLRFLGGYGAPTVRVQGLTVSGD
ncbi:MAG: metallopeptidase TldD-related protein, partial [Bacillota bacterium]|nr:metallopeptidase TldD-related protein [Bacillota bacterium]